MTLLFVGSSWKLLAIESKPRFLQLSDRNPHRVGSRRKNCFIYPSHRHFFVIVFPLVLIVIIEGEKYGTWSPIFSRDDRVINMQNRFSLSFLQTATGRSIPCMSGSCEWLFADDFFIGKIRLSHALCEHGCVVLLKLQLTNRSNRSHNAGLGGWFCLLNYETIYFPTNNWPWKWKKFHLHWPPGLSQSVDRDIVEQYGLWHD